MGVNRVRVVVFRRVVVRVRVDEGRSQTGGLNGQRQRYGNHPAHGAHSTHGTRPNVGGSAEGEPAEVITWKYFGWRAMCRDRRSMRSKL